jgi:hypothetical protein
MKNTQLKNAMDAHAALFLLDTVAETLNQIPHIDNKLSSNVSRWQKQLLSERNRMLPLSDAAHNA